MAASSPPSSRPTCSGTTRRRMPTSVRASASTSSTSSSRRASSSRPWLLLSFHRHRVLVVTPPPEAALVSSPRRAIEPLIHAPHAVQPARVRGIRVVDDAVLEDERAHAWPFARVCRRVGPCRGRECFCSLSAPLPRSLAPEVVFDATFPLLHLGEPDAEVG